MFANRRITEGDERPMLFTYLGKIKIKKVYERKKEDTDNKDTTKWHSIGQKDECTIQIKEGSNEIITPDSTYRLSDEVFLYVYLLSNRAIANIYKIIKDD